ncbi:MAG: D-aminoacyl-tRNA deacylase [Pseudomonadota bacterium]
MRAVVQRVSQASVCVDEQICGAIGSGLLVLLGVGKNDAEQDAVLMADKIAHLRIFEDEQGLMNRSLLEVQGEMLVVSQFTLFGDCRRGRRPSYSTAAPPAEAARLYEQFINEVRTKQITVATGKFQAMMAVTLVNNGPITLLIDTEKQF